MDELTKIFNSAIVSTRVDSGQAGAKARDFSAELYTLVQTPAFSAILSAIRLLARSQNLSEREAAEQMIGTFRRLDGVWTDYVFQEGVDRLRAPAKSLE